MLKNYLIIALRNILRNRTYSFINIAGLAVGMAVFILMALFVLHEMSYDRFHENSDRIYRVVAIRQIEDVESEGVYMPVPLQEQLSEYPEVEHVAVVDYQSLQVVSRGTVEFNEAGGMADSSFFSVFSFQLLFGDPRTALADPFSIVITQELATKYFGTENPMEQVLTVDKNDYRVRGILAPIPSNSHLQFDYLLSYSSYPLADPRRWQVISQTWGLGLQSYVQLTDGVDPNSVAQTMSTLAAEGARIEGPSSMFASMTQGRKFRLQPLTDIHLHSATLDGGYQATLRGDMRVIMIFTSIAFLILLMACINFMNLSTAMLERRTAEVGIRKVVGANRGHLVRQFMGESIVLSFIAVLFSLVLVEIGGPVFNQIIGRAQTEGTLSAVTVTLLVFLVATIVGVISGVHPSLVLSRWRPDAILRGKTQTSKRISLRQILVTTQFTISIGLITCTILAYGQLQFIREKDKGIDTSNIISFTAPSVIDFFQNLDAFKNSLLQSPRIVGFTATTLPLSLSIGTSADWAADPLQGKLNELDRFVVDADFAKSFGIQIVEGRDFSDADATDEFLLNQSAVKALGWDHPIGQTIEMVISENAEGPDRVLQQVIIGERSGRVVGVVEDFHRAPLHVAIQPTILLLTAVPVGLTTYYIRIQPGETQASLAYIKSVWEEYVPGFPFDYHFLDEEIGDFYGDDRRFGVLVGSSSALTVIIACLGLFGLASLATTRRTKEIGIRKVVGASVAQIVGMLSKEFLVLVLIANVIAWPLAWYAMTRWLQNFAYRIDLSWWIFVLAGLLALVIALATVSLQAIRAATANPVEALRYE